AWRELPMEHVDNDRWAGRFLLEENTRYLYTIEAYADPYGSWAFDLRKRLAANMEVGGELAEGAALLRAVLPRAAGADRAWLTRRLGEIEHAAGDRERARLLLDEETAHLVSSYPDRSAATSHDRELEVIADRPRAAFGAWYEMFPRSQG